MTPPLLWNLSRPAGRDTQRVNEQRRVSVAPSFAHAGSAATVTAAGADATVTEMAGGAVRAGTAMALAAPQRCRRARPVRGRPPGSLRGLRVTATAAGWPCGAVARGPRCMPRLVRVDPLQACRGQGAGARTPSCGR